MINIGIVVLVILAIIIWDRVEKWKENKRHDKAMKEMDKDDTIEGYIPYGYTWLKIAVPYERFLTDITMPKEFRSLVFNRDKKYYEVELNPISGKLTISQMEEVAKKYNAECISASFYDN